MSESEDKHQYPWINPVLYKLSYIYVELYEQNTHTCIDLNHK